MTPFFLRVVEHRRCVRSNSRNNFYVVFSEHRTIAVVEGFVFDTLPLQPKKRQVMNLEVIVGRFDKRPPIVASLSKGRTGKFFTATKTGVDDSNETHHQPLSSVDWVLVGLS